MPACREGTNGANAWEPLQKEAGEGGPGLHASALPFSPTPASSGSTLHNLGPKPLGCTGLGPGPLEAWAAVLWPLLAFPQPRHSCPKSLLGTFWCLAGVHSCRWLLAVTPETSQRLRVVCRPRGAEP